MRAGMTKGTWTLGLPSASITWPKGLPSSMTKLAVSRILISFVAAISRRPMESRWPQRLMEATASSAVTAVPSWNSSPGRSLKVQLMRSGLAAQDSSICGRYSPLLSIETSVS